MHPLLNDLLTTRVDETLKLLYSHLEKWNCPPSEIDDYVQGAFINLMVKFKKHSKTYDKEISKPTTWLVNTTSLWYWSKRRNDIKKSYVHADAIKTIKDRHKTSPKPNSEVNPLIAAMHRNK